MYEKSLFMSKNVFSKHCEKFVKKKTNKKNWLYNKNSQKL